MRRSTPPALLHWTAVVTFLLPLVSISPMASAQTCEVVVGDVINVHTGGEVVAVRMAWDRIADVPVVLWNDNASGELIYRRWAGPADTDWEAEVVVPTGRLHVVYHCYGGGSSDPACNGKINALQRENGVWTAPAVVFEHASGMDMAVGPDDFVHVVTLQGGGNQHHAWYSHGQDGQSWSEKIQITDEPPGDCFAGPLSCWPAIATDIGGAPSLAYGVDPDPCCEEVGECHWPDLPNNEPTWTDCCGHISTVSDEGGGWTGGNPVEVLDDVALHASLTEFAIDPTGVKYIFGPNYHRELAYVRPDGTTGVAVVDVAGGGRIFFLHSTATGDGGWLTYPIPINMGVSDTVIVRHFERTGDCAAGSDCSPGMTRVCGLCGTQACDGSSQWGPCEDEGECYPEVGEACGEDGGSWTCGFDCQWENESSSTWVI